VKRFDCAAWNDLMRKEGDTIVLMHHAFIGVTEQPYRLLVTVFRFWIEIRMWSFRIKLDVSFISRALPLVLYIVTAVHGSHISHTSRIPDVRVLCRPLLIISHFSCLYGYLTRERYYTRHRSYCTLQVTLYFGEVSVNFTEVTVISRYCTLRRSYCTLRRT
jgi:hypothetical protein